jgi:hypothetical protein
MLGECIKLPQGKDIHGTISSTPLSMARNDDHEKVLKYKNKWLHAERFLLTIWQIVEEELSNLPDAWKQAR